MEAGQKPRGILGHHLVYDEEADAGRQRARLRLQAAHMK